MNKRQIINQTADMIKHKFESEGSGHDWWHIYRVWQIAKTIAQKEKIDIFIVELGVLLHDIADYKFHDGNELIGGIESKKWLKKLGVESQIIDEVIHIVDNVSFKGNAKHNKMKSLEGKVVQDADRLDSMGAIGIARVFAYGGNKGREIYNPEVKPRLNMTKEEYKKNNSSSVNHFYEKLLLLKDLMNTKTGRKIAIKRHKFMEQYLKTFFDEWSGKK